MNREERREFVRAHRTAVLGYNRKSDGPAQSIVYYVMDGEEILVSTMAARAKAKAVERLGKVSTPPSIRLPSTSTPPATSASSCSTASATPLPGRRRNS